MLGFDYGLGSRVKGERFRLGGSGLVVASGFGVEI